MNKRANRKAFFVCISIFLVYLWVGMGLYERSIWQRNAYEGKIGASNMGMNLKSDIKKDEKKEIEPLTTKVEKEGARERKLVRKEGGAEMVEPSYLISVPFVLFAIKQNLLEKDSLIPSKKDGPNNILSWKRPLDILRERDDEGLINISKTIGLKNMVRLLREEGVEVEEGLSPGEIMLGRGYVIERNKLLGLYNKYVGDEYRSLFPYSSGNMTISKKGGGFELVSLKVFPQDEGEHRIDGWYMPDVRGLPLKTALERLTNYTDNIRIYGFGIVQDQFPKPQDRVLPDTVCILYGKGEGR
ncbi:MAG: hypothetical protein N2745_00670 [Syntrophorhabdaceae bacterium]|nr:hypothetical protein [Syntrophorhabdaceae bacterium]